ncbi:uncharacterized protein LOC125758863 [Rhipicephalus sanguineus]|uniref:uncharacterized protein LOC125758863 n=1 Tax=Rhipicephalus sanguineus TaxID=34632 RepID=UPI0020C4E506|nr:uncharacterized protein LOC125758863 [Rhipicephalus sanguineus]
MFSSMDMKGVYRGQCTSPQCECDGFCRAVNNEPAAPYQAGWCAYCGHSPVQHVRIGSTENVFFMPPYVPPSQSQEAIETHNTGVAQEYERTATGGASTSSLVMPASQHTGGCQYKFVKMP